MYSTKQEWRILSLNQVLEEYDVRNKNNKDIPVLSVTQGKGIILQSEKYNKQIASDDQSNYKIVPYGALAFNPNYLNFGAVGVQERVEEGLVSSIYGVFKIKNQELLNYEFMKQLIRSPIMIHEYNKYANGSCAVVHTGELQGMHVRLAVTIKDFKEIKWKFPTLKEQQKIADILSTVDEQIDNTDRLIEKTKELKKGLMQQLLTKGIGYTEFKITELGEIPVGWEITEINNIVVKIVGGGTPSRDNLSYYNGPIPWVTVKDMDNSFFKHDAQEHINEVAIKESSANLIDAYQVIIATRIALGRGFINVKPMAINQDLKAVYLHKKVILPDYFLYWYLSQKGKIESMGSGSTVKGIRVEQLRKLMLPLPSLIEQQKIVEILSSIDEQIENYEHEKEKYTELKKGLMQQLLTGKIRVTV